MKSVNKTLLIGVMSLLSLQIAAQETDTSFFDGNGGVIESNIPTSIDLSQREPIQYNNPRAEDVVWQQVVYRIIDLREKINFPLYFPEVAEDHRQSLFTTIFRLYEQGKIKGYDYEAERELFDETTEIKFEDIVKKYGTMVTYDIDTISGDTLGSVINEVDIPNKEVVKYYLKEVCYFDKSNSTFNVRIMAICPKIYQMNDEGVLEGSPMFWIPFDSLRPYLARQEAYLTDRNNGARETMDDLFIKRKFNSYIFKTSNMRNRNLIEYNTTIEQAKKEQDLIKTAIINYEQDLWEY